MKRAFIRGLWGIYEHNQRRFYTRRAKQDNDIKMVKLNKNAAHHITYVFGSDNQKYLEDEGFETRLVDKRPIVWNMETEQFRHKLEVLYQGLSEFDEIVFLDWDCTECRPLPENFWDRLGEKQPIQAVLRRYNRNKIKWRKEEGNIIPEASFVYIRNKEIGGELNDLWQKMGRPWSEEIVILKYIENINGGWKGVEDYWEKYNPFFATYGRCKLPPPYALEYGYQYIHINNVKVAKIIKRAKSNSDQLTHLLEKYTGNYKK